ncbi:putative toxin-antitoxin system toxin component, PIN family [Dokdonella sp.]|uniref:putative toxin-antitoxin system toxin component, PIN family n=1 Tax=Dokdonella sp. TaxID=2291710 RepID=UPI002B776B02|nr:putative toxin-antitoxin system toxin component, PIN family [Dokdonella sp.]HNV09133.1 putative toxin-antitoxin system toxin component, PIN family [Dokdonella sp.]HPW02893.1 putative toxin-antitoxin system toxin component, PIN family [Dokdonella sp.]
MSGTPLRVVLDTNVVVSALVFRSEVARRLRAAWQRGACKPMVSSATTRELLRVLAYPKFRLSADDRQELLADYLPWTQSLREPETAAILPKCRDAHDAIFLELAAAGRARFLISGDHDLLALAGRTPFSMVNPAEFLMRLEKSS